jgi:hypothetical protein
VGCCFGLLCVVISFSFSFSWCSFCILLMYLGTPHAFNININMTLLIKNEKKKQLFNLPTYFLLFSPSLLLLIV